MWLIRWLTQNWADTDVPSPPDLAPLDLPLPLSQAVERTRNAVGSLPRWRIESIDEAAGLIHATRRTPLWGFIDDITIRLEASAAGTRVHARSKSRVGAADLGQNHRNILELFRVLRQSG